MSELTRPIAEALGYRFVEREYGQVFDIYLPDGTQYTEKSVNEPGVTYYAFSAALWLHTDRAFPRWDTDLNAAWQLLEHAAKEHDVEDIEFYRGNSGAWYSCRIVNRKLNFLVREYGDTPAQAICKVFLAFMERVGEVVHGTD